VPSFSFPPSKHVLESKLDDAGVYGERTSDLPERWTADLQRAGVDCAHAARIGKLGMVKGIKKLGPQLDRLPLSNVSRLDQRDIPIELSRTKNDAGARIAEQRSSGW